MMDRVRVYDWFSWSHWGMFREPLATMPYWFAQGMVDVDDDDIEDLPVQTASEIADVLVATGMG